MSPIAKVFIVINLVLSIVFIGMAASLLATGDQYRLEYESEAAEHDKTKHDFENEINQLRADLDTKNSELSQAQNNFLNETAKTKKLQSDLEAEKASSKELRNSVDGLDNNYRSLDGKLKDSMDRNADLEDKRRLAEERERSAVKKQEAAEADFARAESELTDVKEQLASFEMNNQELTEQLASANNRLAKAIEQGFKDLEAPPPINGKVLRVDDTLGMVMLSVGSDEGVKKGFIFDVYRGQEYVGRVIVDDVMSDFSSAIIEKTRIPIQELDDATTRL